MWSAEINFSLHRIFYILINREGRDVNFVQADKCFQINAEGSAVSIVSP